MKPSKYRRKRWISERMAERSGQPASTNRVIEIWCEEPSHEEVYIGSAHSKVMGPYEGWRVPADGPHVTRQLLTSPGREDQDFEHLSTLGLVADRIRLLCPDCGLDVLAADRLTSGGVRKVFDTEDQFDKGRSLAHVEMDQNAWVAREKTDSLLSAVADAGRDRLALSSLARIISV